MRRAYRAGLIARIVKGRSDSQIDRPVADAPRSLARNCRNATDATNMRRGVGELMPGSYLAEVDAARAGRGRQSLIVFT